MKGCFCPTENMHLLIFNFEPRLKSSTWVNCRLLLARPFQGGSTIFERFTDRARRIIVLAQEDARALSHNYIGTEHILLGLVHEGEGVAAQALSDLGVTDYRKVSDVVVEYTGEGNQSPSGHIPFTPRARKVLELSLREALQLGHNYIGTEHVLLGLIAVAKDDPGAVAAMVLAEVGVAPNEVRQAVIARLAATHNEAQATATFRTSVPKPKIQALRRAELDLLGEATTFTPFSVESVPAQREAVQWLGTEQSLAECAAFAPGKIYQADDDPLLLLAGVNGVQGWVQVPQNHWLLRHPGDPSDVWPVEEQYFATNFVDTDRPKRPSQPREDFTVVERTQLIDICEAKIKASQSTLWGRAFDTSQNSRSAAEWLADQILEVVQDIEAEAATS